jgi:thimet oligopeptidase
MLHSPAHVKQADQTAQLFRTECLEGLRRAEALRPEIIAHTARTIDETLVRYNQLLTAASASNALAGLMSEVHPDEAIRDVARECEQAVSRFYSDLALDREMYDTLAAVNVSDADADTQRFVAHTLRDYRRAGVDKSPEVRTRLKQIDEELTKLGQQFSKNISEDVRGIAVEPARLAGLPSDFIASHPADADGKVRVTTDYPDYNPVMTYATDDALRKEIYVAFRSRGDQHNEGVLRDILELRAEKASLLGFTDWADYITADKMIGSGSRASEFIEKVWKLAAPRAEQDYSELLRQRRLAEGVAREPRQEGALRGRRERGPPLLPVRARARRATADHVGDLRPVVRAAARCRGVAPERARVRRDARRRQARADLPRHASARRQVQARRSVPAQGRRARRPAA